MRICLAGPSLFPPVGAVLVVRIILEVLRTITVLLAGLLVEQLADGFNRTSFHGFLAKRVLLRGGRLLRGCLKSRANAKRTECGIGFIPAIRKLE